VFTGTVYVNCSSALTLHYHVSINNTYRYVHYVLVVARYLVHQIKNTNERLGSKLHDW